MEAPYILVILILVNILFLQMLLKSSCITTTKFRGVVRGCAGCAIAHPDFGRSVNPISTRGTDYAHLNTTGTPGFSDLPTALDY